MFSVATSMNKSRSAVARTQPCAAKGSIPRRGYDVYLNDHKVDMVRSGGFSPSLRVGIGTTFLPTHSVKPGTKIEIEARGRRMDGEVTTLPFYKEGSVKRH